MLLSRGLRDAGHATSLFCHPDGRLRKNAMEIGLETVPLRARGQLDLAAALRLVPQLRRLRPEIVHLHTPREYISATLAARLARVPRLVITRHMVLPVKPLMRFIYHRADAVICHSRAAFDNLREQGVPVEKLHLVYAAIDTADWSRAAANNSGPSMRRELGVRPDEILIGIAGRLVAGKGHDLFLQAASQLAALPSESTPPLKFLIAGDGPQRLALQAQAETLGIAEHVVFTGFHPDLPAVMAALDIFVMASPEPEVMPLVLMEAMAAARPVVASQVGGVPEIVEDEVNGLLVPPGDAQALARSLQRLIYDAPLRARLAAQGQRKVWRDFDLPRLIAETERIYRRLHPAPY